MTIQLKYNRYLSRKVRTLIDKEAKRMVVEEAVVQVGLKLQILQTSKLQNTNFILHVMGKHQMLMFEAVKEHSLENLQIDLHISHNILTNLRSGVNNSIPIGKPIMVIGPSTRMEYKTDSSGDVNKV